jgi:hypothetical protein
MGKHEEIWQSINDLDDRVTRLEERAILKPDYHPDDVAFDNPRTRIADLEREVERLTAERDALRARIEAGRVMYGNMYGHQNKFEMWTFEHVDTDTMTALLIDIAPIAADERRGVITS